MYDVPHYTFWDQTKKHKGQEGSDFTCFGWVRYSPVSYPIWVGEYSHRLGEPGYFKTFQQYERKFIRRVIRCFRPECGITMDSKTRTISCDIRNMHSDEFTMMLTMFRQMYYCQDINMLYDEAYKKSRSHMLASWISFAVLFHSMDYNSRPPKILYNTHTPEDINFAWRFNCGHNVAYGDLMTVELLKQLKTAKHLVPFHPKCSDMAGMKYKHSYACIWFMDEKQRPDYMNAGNRAYVHNCRGEARHTANHLNAVMPKNPGETVKSFIHRIIQPTK